MKNRKFLVRKLLAGLVLAGLSGFAVAPASANDDGVRIYLPGDITGNGNADLIHTDSAGDLWMRTGSNNGRFQAQAEKIGHGWSNRTVIPAGDLNGDGRPDILSTDADGLLWFYPGRGNGRLGAAINVGHGWKGDDRIFPAGDLNGDGRIDLLAIDTDGLLWFYRGRGDGTFGKRVQAGHGWSAGDRLYLGGDLAHTPAHDLLAVRDGGQLWVYPGRGDGTFHSAQWVGGGWAGLQVAVGDVNNDGVGDIVSYDRGAIRTHLGKGAGKFRASIDATGTSSASTSSPKPVDPPRQDAFNQAESTALCNLLAKHRPARTGVVPTCSYDKNRWSTGKGHTVTGSMSGGGQGAYNNFKNSPAHWGMLTSAYITGYNVSCGSYAEDGPGGVSCSVNMVIDQALQDDDIINDRYPEYWR